MSVRNATRLLAGVFAIAMGVSTSFGTEPGPRAAVPSLSRPAVARPLLVRLPPVTAPIPSAVPATPQMRPSDGTFREDGRFLVLNLNGQEYRLVRDGPASAESNQRTQPNGGGVYGRLSHVGRPLVNCEVELIPLHKAWNGYRTRPSENPIIAVTDANGVYRLSNVAPGPYKLRWRPDGEDAWIRRIELRPDVHVRLGETSEVQEIRVSLRTIN